MIGWFKNRSTGKKVLLNIISVECNGYGIEYKGIEVKTGKEVMASYHGEYFPYGTPVRKRFPTLSKV
jgi:hypothetical protein